MSENPMLGLVPFGEEVETFAEPFDSEDYPDEVVDEYWSAVEQGMYDDDPNPYHGDYSEM